MYHFTRPPQRTRRQLRRMGQHLAELGRKAERRQLRRGRALARRAYALGLLGATLLGLLGLLGGHLVDLVATIEGRGLVALGLALVAILVNAPRRGGQE